jgi:hypothetical protein
MNKYYTYAYLREDGTPYYIGKGCGVRINNPSSRTIPMPPLERRVKLRTDMTEEEALAHEKELIAYYGRKDLGEGILRNLTDGGDSPGRVIRRPETIAKWREKVVGIRWDMKQSTKDKLAAYRCNNTYELIDNQGNVCYTTNIRKFAKDRGLSHGPLYKLLHKQFVNKSNNYRGWVSVRYVEDMGLRAGS